MWLILTPNEVYSNFGNSFFYIFKKKRISDRYSLVKHKKILKNVSVQNSNNKTKFKCVQGEILE